LMNSSTFDGQELARCPMTGITFSPTKRFERSG
jgi:uncharacterized C2H2 Zn-finger protein